MKHIGINFCLFISGLLFVIGMLGIILNRRNLISIFMSLELILLSVNLNFVFFSIYLKDMAGQIYSIFILTIAAAEAAIGLAILVNYFRQRQTIEADDLNQIPEENAYIYDVHRA